MNIRATDVPCPSCGDMILERSYIPYIPDMNEEIIGQGLNNAATESDRVIDGYHCMTCMAQYYDLPKEELKPLLPQPGRNKTEIVTTKIIHMGDCLVKDLMGGVT